MKSRAERKAVKQQIEATAADTGSVTRFGRFSLPDWQIALGLLLLVGLTYGHTLHAPWYLDDHHAIIENERLRHFGLALKDLFGFRGPALFSFFLNYQLHELWLPGFHLVNILIHFLSSWFAYLLAKRLLGEGWGAVVVSLTFALHPLQIQAVTYIVQRMASLSTLFFLLGCYWFCRFRDGGKEGERWSRKALIYYLLALLAGGLAVLTKQNAAVFPVVLLLLDRFFLNRGGRWRSSFLCVAPILLVPLLFGLWQVILPLLVGGKELADVASFHGDKISSLQYLFTEFSVIWLYIRLLFLPYPQKLEYGYWVNADLLTPYSLAGLLGLLGLLGFAWFGRKRYPLLSCGILWFLLGLAVESTLIPLEPVFEHRLYLPMFGFGLFLAGCLVWLRDQRRVVLALVVLTLVWGGLTWHRNNQWNNVFTFYLDNLHHAPEAAPVHLKLARIYNERQQTDLALDHYVEAYRIRQDRPSVLKNIVFLSMQKNDLVKAKKFGLLALKKGGRWPGINYNLGLIAYDEAAYAEAEQYFLSATRQKDNFPKAWYMLGRSAHETGNRTYLEQAIEKLSSLDPGLLKTLLEES